jgi:hypothetical protein
MQRNELGTAVFGGTIALVGVLLLLDRAGALTWPRPWGVWPLLLIGYGLSRMVQSRYDAPRGLFPLALGAWFYGGQAGWFLLRETWPLLLVALGLGIAWSAFIGPEPLIAADAPDAIGGTPDADSRRLRRRRRHGPFVPLAIVILIVIAARDNADRAFARTDAADRAHAVAVLGETSRSVNTAPFGSGEMVAVMGQSVLDLRQTALPAGGEASVEVNVVMGGAVLRVPPEWALDVQAVSVLGSIHDRRRASFDAPAAASGPTSRLVVTGNVVMGELAIVSDSSH